MTGRQDQPALPEAANGDREDAVRSLRSQPRSVDRSSPDRPVQPEQWRVEQRPRDPIQEQLIARMWRLPPGHPSSPYDHNGKLRPPARSLRDLELRGEEAGLEDPAGKPQHPEGARTLGSEQADRPKPTDRELDSAHDTSQSWRNALPHLQDLWQKHQEKWPEGERPTVDRSNDEPGSWRGDSGAVLGPRDSRRVDEVYQQVVSYEAKITKQMTDIERVSSGQLIGKENRLKGRDRFKDKVASGLESAPNADVDHIAANVRDVVRYTLQYDDSKYTRGVHTDVERLQSCGMQLVKLKNFWADQEYKGINSQWRDIASGQSFEVQFHTKISFEAKELTHGAYERLRTMHPNSHDSQQQINELHAFQRTVCTKIPMPEGATNIQNYP